MVLSCYFVAIELLVVTFHEVLIRLSSRQTAVGHTSYEHSSSHAGTHRQKTTLKLIKNQETSKPLNQLLGYVLDPRRAKKKVAVFPLTKIAFTKIGYSLEHMILDDTSASVTNGILALVILRLVLLSSKMQKCY